MTAPGGRGGPVNLLLVTQDFPPRPGGMARYYADLARGLGASCTVAAGAWEGRPAEASGGPSPATLPFGAGASHRPWNLCGRPPAGRGPGRRAPRRPPVRQHPPLRTRCGPAGRAEAVPLVQIYHGNDLLRTARRWRGHPEAAPVGRVRDAAALHVVNSAYTAGLAAAAGPPAERIAVVPPEVDTARFRPRRDAERRALRRRLGWPETSRSPSSWAAWWPGRGWTTWWTLSGGSPGAPGSWWPARGPGGVAERAAAGGVLDRVRFLGLVATTGFRNSTGPRTWWPGPRGTGWRRTTWRGSGSSSWRPRPAGCRSWPPGPGGFPRRWRTAGTGSWSPRPTWTRWPPPGAGCWRTPASLRGGRRTGRARSTGRAGSAPDRGREAPGALRRGPGRRDRRRGLGPAQCRLASLSRASGASSLLGNSRMTVSK